MVADLSRIVRSTRKPPVLDWDEYISIAQDCGIGQDQVLTVTQHLHRVGCFLLALSDCFGHTDTVVLPIGVICTHLKAGSRSLLNRIVILDPLWLVHIFRAVLFGAQACALLFPEAPTNTFNAPPLFWNGQDEKQWCDQRDGFVGSMAS